jgi:hypothetical protein
MHNTLALSAPQQIAGPVVHHFVLPKPGIIHNTTINHRSEAIQEPWVNLEPNNEKSTSLQSTIVSALLNVVTLITNYLPPVSVPLPPIQNQTAFFNASAINPVETIINANNTAETIKKRGKYNCWYGFQGRYCDQCGLIASMPNMKIVGGSEANPHSWPAAALITFNYKADVYLKDQGVYYALDEQMMCGGSLISRDTSERHF